MKHNLHLIITCCVVLLFSPLAGAEKKSNIERYSPRPNKNTSAPLLSKIKSTRLEPIQEDDQELTAQLLIMECIQNNISMEIFRQKLDKIIKINKLHCCEYNLAIEHNRYDIIQLLTRYLSIPTNRCNQCAETPLSLAMKLKTGLTHKLQKHCINQ